jgi:endonuclease-8
VPEGDTVWLVAKRLNDALAGQLLNECDLRVPALATTDLSGREVTEVVPRGKHILTRVGGGLTLHSHLRMDGMWYLYRRGSRWNGGPGHLIRAVLGTEQVHAVGYHLHDLAVVNTGDEAELVGHLGPDLLSPDFDIAEVIRRITADPTCQIGPALLDQRNLAGIGNIYKAETLFMEGINPWTPVSEIDDAGLERLILLARRLLERNKVHFSQATTGDPRRGHEHWVTSRTRRPCRRCGTPIRRHDQGEPPRQRVTYWCPTCQPGPEPS